MSDLTFEVVGVSPERYCAAPTITFRVRITEMSGDSIYAVALRTQIMIEPQRRRYEPEEEQRLLAQFGERERWGQTLKPFFWATVGTMVTQFTESVEIDIQVPLTYDWELASTKFLHAIETGEVPVNLLFNGTIISKGESGFSIEPVPWNKEARFGVPAGIWRAVMDIYFPGTGLDPHRAGHARQARAVPHHPGPHVVGAHLRRAPRRVRPAQRPHGRRRRAGAQGGRGQPPDAEVGAEVGAAPANGATGNGNGASS